MDRNHRLQVLLGEETGFSEIKESISIQEDEDLISFEEEGDQTEPWPEGDPGEPWPHDPDYPEVQEYESTPFTPFMFPTEEVPVEDREYESDGWDLYRDRSDSECSPVDSTIQADVEHTISSAVGAFGLKPGHRAGGDFYFCSLQSVLKYPDCFIGEGNRQRVSETAFDGGKVFERKWNFFYLYPGKEHNKNRVIILVPTVQFEEFLSEINQKLGTKLTIPPGHKNAMSFRMNFPNDGTPRPRYLGESTDKEMANQMKTGAPPQVFQPDKGMEPIIKPNDRSLEAFKQKIDALLTMEKLKKAKNKEKKQEERAVKQKQMNDALKRVQRYLGLREVRDGHHQAMRQPNSDQLEWSDYDQAVNAAVANPDYPTELNVNSPPIFSMEQDLVFVCVDVESNERVHSQITEVGVATLDTRDIVSLAPGEGGKNWFPKIRARHFRIKEYAHVVNGDYVQGCPDRFEFGDSEFIPLKEAPKVVASCFKAPFSGPGEGVATAPRRQVAFVGHDAMGDVRYLKDLGYNVLNLPPFEIVDTADMYRSYCREVNPRNLGSILADLGIAGWHLHNAGNDAVYTLQSMIGISIKAAEKGECVKTDEQRVAEAMEQIRLDTLKDLKGWHDDGSDGGAPVKPPSQLQDTAKERAAKEKEASKIQQPFTNPRGRAGSIAGLRGLYNPSDSRSTSSTNRGSGSGRGMNPSAAPFRQPMIQTQNISSNANSTVEWPALPSKAPAPVPDLTQLRNLAIQATNSKDKQLINELASEAAKSKSALALMQAVAEGTCTAAQRDVWGIKVENAASLLAWEGAGEKENEGFMGGAA